MQRQLCDIDTIVLSYIYNQPFEGKPNTDVAQDEIEFDTPDLPGDWKTWKLDLWQDRKEERSQDMRTEETYSPQISTESYVV